MLCSHEKFTSISLSGGGEISFASDNPFSIPKLVSLLRLICRRKITNLQSEDYKCKCETEQVGKLVESTHVTVHLPECVCMFLYLWRRSLRQQSRSLAGTLT